MARGIGIRYTASGVRAIEMNNDGGKPEITGIAAGQLDGDLGAFLRDRDMAADGTAVVCGLGPGLYLSASIPREKEMNNHEVRDQLRWEIERKIAGEADEYIIDVAITDSVCFAFAGRRKLIDGIKAPFRKCVADVEAVALYNGCDLLGETRHGASVILSIEPEGISSILVNEGMIEALESYPVREEGIASLLLTLDGDGMKSITQNDTGRFFQYATESINRICMIGGRDPKNLEAIALTGVGVYFGDMMGRLKESYDTFVTATNPFKFASPGVRGMNDDIESKGAAFTSCFGLAARALEE